jgi:hypothetical protein
VTFSSLAVVSVRACEKHCATFNWNFRFELSLGAKPSPPAPSCQPQTANGTGPSGWQCARNIPATEEVVNRIFDAAKQSSRILTEQELLALCPSSSTPV